MGLGSSIGSALGGAIGSIFPGAGTAIGAGIGGAAGGLVDSATATNPAQQRQSRPIDYNSPIRKQIKQQMQASLASKFAGMNSTPPLRKWEGGLR